MLSCRIFFAGTGELYPKIMAMFDSPLVPISLSILPIQLQDLFRLSSQNTAWKEKPNGLGKQGDFRVWCISCVGILWNLGELIWKYIMVHLFCFLIKKNMYNCLTRITNSLNCLPTAKVHNYTKQDDVLNWFGVCTCAAGLIAHKHACSDGARK